MLKSDRLAKLAYETYGFMSNYADSSARSWTELNEKEHATWVAVAEVVSDALFKTVLEHREHYGPDNP